ncbi:hypothetical protein C0214_23530 [Methylobacterium sp. DM1]|nr:hypothetical protein C0214_23530 [Methylobacterium sp. DM1]
MFLFRPPAPEAASADILGPWAFAPLDASAKSRGRSASTLRACHMERQLFHDVSARTRSASRKACPTGYAVPAFASRRRRA